MYEPQNWGGQISVSVDSDFAGDQCNRKSNSGGLIKLGSHLIKAWSSMQKVIALSSGEAEYYSLVKGASQAMGVRSLLGDMGLKARVKVMTVIESDATAAIGIANRKGLGNVRHIDVAKLWVQDHVRSGSIKIKKVGTNDNYADALTKPVEQAHIQWHLLGTGQRVLEGSHEITLR